MGYVYILEQKSQQFPLINPQTSGSPRGKAGFGLRDIKLMLPTLLCGLQVIATMT